MGNDLVWIEVEGGVVSDPKMVHTKRGTTFCKFGVVSEPKIRKNGTKFVNGMYFTVIAAGATGETVYPMIKPGTPIRVEGQYSDGIYRDRITDEPKNGRVIYASRVKVFVFWKYRDIKEKKRFEDEQINNMVMPDTDDLPL